MRTWVTTAAAGVLALSLLAPALAMAQSQSQQGPQPQQGGGWFNGLGQLWSGTTRSAGAPPGAVPGTELGQHAHQQGLADQPRESPSATPGRQRTGPNG